MSLLTISQVIKRVQVMLDDPGGKRFSVAYIEPFLDQENEAFLTSLSVVGVQQQEQIAIINLPAATVGANGSTPPVDLKPYFAQGGPLQYLWRPKRLDWKVQGYPDTGYDQANKVDELDDVSVGNIGVAQYRWAAGSVQLTPSYTPVTIRLYFWVLATSMNDPSQPVMNGIGFVLARQAALEIASSNNNMGKLADRLEKSLARDKRNLKNLFVMEGQAENKFPRGTKRGTGVQISAGGKAYT